MVLFFFGSKCIESPANSIRRISCTGVHRRSLAMHASTRFTHAVTDTFKLFSRFDYICLLFQQCFYNANYINFCIDAGRKLNLDVKLAWLTGYVILLIFPKYTIRIEKVNNSMIKWNQRANKKRLNLNWASITSFARASNLAISCKCDESEFIAILFYSDVYAETKHTYNKLWFVL